MSEEPLVKEVLWGWRVFETLARRTNPPVLLPPQRELQAIEEAFLEKPFSQFTRALKAWALGKGLGSPGLPEIRREEKGGLILEAPYFRPYPFVLGFEGEKPLFFALRGRTVRHSIRVSPRRILFGRERSVPVTFLSRVDELYSPIVLPLFGLEFQWGTLGEALRRGIRLDWGDELFRQANFYILPEKQLLKLTVWDAEKGEIESFSLGTEEEFAHALYEMVIKRGPLFTSGPIGPLKVALRNKDEEGLKSLRQFADLLAHGYLQVLKAIPEASPLLPRFLPDGRWLRGETERGKIKVWVGKRLLKKIAQEKQRSAPSNDPLLDMRVYWDNLALDLSSGSIDLLELVPEPLLCLSARKLIFFTPTWAVTQPLDQPFDRTFTETGI